MSKRHGAKKKRKVRARKRVLCASCHQAAAPEGLLQSVAAALNACTDAGVRVRLRNFNGIGLVDTSRGYVLPLRDGHWGARSQDFTTYGDMGADDED